MTPDPKTIEARNFTITLPSDREIVMTHWCDAPRRLVWEAWTRPEHVRRWMTGPEGWTMPVCEMDLRPGGRWRFVMLGPDGQQGEMGGVYREVSPPERLAMTESWGGDWPETVNTVTLTEENGRTRIDNHVLYPSQEARDRARGAGMEEGAAPSYERLDRLVAELEEGNATGRR